MTESPKYLLRIEHKEEFVPLEFPTKTELATYIAQNKEGINYFRLEMHYPGDVYSGSFIRATLDNERFLKLTPPRTGEYGDSNSYAFPLKWDEAQIIRFLEARLI